jgi:plastocyanin
MNLTKSDLIIILIISIMAYMLKSIGIIGVILLIGIYFYKSDSSENFDIISTTSSTIPLINTQITCTKDDNSCRPPIDHTATNHIITITDKGVVPAAIVINPGDTVTWINNGANDSNILKPAVISFHQIRSEMGLFTAYVAPNSSYKHTFTNMNKYDFFINVGNWVNPFCGYVLVTDEKDEKNIKTPVSVQCPDSFIKAPWI